MDYQSMLKRGLSKVPKKEATGDRFEIPRIKTQKSGSRTTLVNLGEVSHALNREQGHMVKFILKELATSGDVKGGTLEVQGSFGEEHVNKKLENYIKNFVICKECGKYDTKMTKDKGFFYLKCEVCGASYPVDKV